MIRTTTHKPTSLLEEFVNCFYFNISDNFEYSGHATPTINQELFFNLGDCFELTNSFGHRTSEKIGLAVFKQSH